ncbi:hypothetical protein DFP93_104217 [Aneurinibacillus soli]|uniref:Uncharacterized protein n=1 Tax=Aneurinibacillus soli TaxID=1500254 RepID=A0A0U4WEE1_9BACL|nr:hypothetical protein [Aneurinibacillus soli]PYE62566.1 hypothetical protein DFP93_104217 [Aneurinibacillus soli]BAU27128.1 hypothetical protein CB4_01297 [Aneurinibacillus soli]
MLRYYYDTEELDIEETENGQDREFHFHFKSAGQNMHDFQKVRAHFNRDRVITDVFFYPQADQRCRVIVRNDYYIDFVLVLFKYQILSHIEWI